MAEIIRRFHEKWQIVQKENKYWNSIPPYPVSISSLILSYWKSKVSQDGSIELLVDINSTAGETSEILARVCGDILALDSSAEMISMAKAASTVKNVHHQIIGAGKTAVSRKMFSTEPDVVMIKTFPYFSAVSSVYGDVIEWLRPGGLVIQTNLVTHSVIGLSDEANEEYHGLFQRRSGMKRDNVVCNLLGTYELSDFVQFRPLQLIKEYCYSVYAVWSQEEMLNFLLLSSGATQVTATLKGELGQFWREQVKEENVVVRFCLKTTFHKKAVE